MGKLTWKPGTMIYPLPVVLVSCGATIQEYNVLTVAWTGTTCTNPAMCYISIRPERYSYDIIKRNGCFVINLTTTELAKATDWCGVKSGRDVNKFKETGLTPIPATIVSAPMIEESPINIECVVKDIIPLGSHDMFLSEVVAVNADEKYYDSWSGTFSLNNAKPICYSHGKYYEVGKSIGKFGFSVKKK
ncbi:MAG: flavin reductase family protein [Bacteroidales bacterium]|nr:flavin reductase family protein [Bacteroidales bacterium]